MPASGHVRTKTGEPCTGALVVFHPTDSERVNDPKPVGICDADGRFVLTTEVLEDGARPGAYGVTIVWNDENAQESKMSLFGEAPSGPDRLGGRYGEPQSPKFSVIVEADASNSFEFVVE